MRRETDRKGFSAAIRAGLDKTLSSVPPGQSAESVKLHAYALLAEHGEGLTPAEKADLERIRK
jgi:hypothetical protein